MVQRVTLAGLLSALAQPGSARVTEHGLEVLLGQPGNSRVSSHGITVLTGQPGNVFVSEHGIYLAISSSRPIFPTFIDSESEVYQHIIDVDMVDVEIPEINPYRPDVPQEFHDLNPVFYDFYREVQETLRKQHNITQAGDSTYHWSVLTKVTEEQLFTPGSLGKFYHESYGIIHARYVQFQDMLESNWIGAPAGRLAKHAEFNWIVTNNILKSHSDWVCGFISSFTQPMDGEFGWLIVSGPNLYSIQLDQVESPNVNDPLIWTDTAKAKSNIAGKSFGRVISIPTVNGLPPGYAKIEIEGWSDAYYIDLIDEATAASFTLINQTLTTHTTQINELTNTVDSIEAVTSSASTKLLLLQMGLNNEVSARTNADTAIRAEIATALLGSVSESELTAFGISLTNAFTIADDGLRILITSAQNRADQAYDLVTNLGLESIITQLNALQTLVGAMDVRLREAEKIWLPLVTGDVPPVLVYLDDGRLIRVEVD